MIDFSIPSAPGANAFAFGESCLARSFIKEINA